MKRTLLLGLLLIALVGGAGVLLWYLAYGTDEAPPPQTQIAGLSHPATIQWQESGIAHIEAATPSDAVAALGYVHGTQRAWSLALWRQTALGRLSEWFGRGMLPLDRHARRLGLAALAQQTHAQLPDSTRNLLASYAAGVNAAFQGRALQQHDELVLLDLAPAAWEPWHTLAVERLFAWLATSPPSDSALAATDSATVRFFDADEQFRQWLHLHGFERGIAWAVQETRGPSLFQRHVYGASAHSLLHETILGGKGADTRGAALPGTPFFPAGRSAQHAWSLLLSSPLDLTFAPVDSSVLATVHERVHLRDGNEVLITTQRTPRALPLGTPDTRPFTVESLALPDTLSSADSVAIVDSIRTRRRSVWQVRWPGFRPATDAAAWQALGKNRSATFRLMDGRGLRATADGAVRVLGDPPVVERFEGGVLVGQTGWARDQAQSLRVQWTSAAPPSLTTLSAHDSSTWAADLASRLMPFLLMTEPSSPRLREATTYLRNWDFTYDRASIGASVFDAWMRAHRADTDSLPRLPDRAPLSPPEDSLARVQWADSLHADSLRRADIFQRTLQHAVDSLTQQFGPDPRRWRWERVNATCRYFPVWPADSLVNRDLHDLTDTRYAPIERPGRGHPSALSGGTSLLDPSPLAPAAWEGWTAPTSSRFTARSPRSYIDVFLGRYAASDRRPAPTPLQHDEAPAATTVLRPSQ